MSRRIPAHWIVVHRAPSVLVRGWQAGDVLRRHGFKPLWSNIARGWVLDEDRLGDVAAIAGLVTRGYSLTHEDGTDCECTVASRERRLRDVDPSCSCMDLAPLAPELVDLLGAVELEHWHRRSA